MLSVIIVVHLMLVVAMIGVVLLQKSEGGGVIGSSSGFLTSRGTANVLTRTTALLAAGFFATSLAMSWLASFERKPASIMGGAPPVQESPTGAPPVAPLSQGSEGLLKQLGGGNAPATAPTAPTAPAAPGPAPSGPEVPQSR